MTQARLEKRRRAVSRVALYGSVTLTLALAVLLLFLAGAPLLRGTASEWGQVDYESLEEVRLLREYVRIDTSIATGRSRDGALFLARQLDAAGIPYHVERLGETDANLWAVLDGKDPGAVVLHHHIDVEDVTRPDEWELPPFGADIDPPWLYGRGTFDMKSIGIAQLLAMIDLAQRGEPLRKSVILLATTGEETGSELGTRWILRQHPELVERFEVVLTEGGVLEGRSYEDLKYWGTEFAQKRYWTLTACAPDRERLEALRGDLLVYGTSLDTELRIPDEVRAFLRRYAPTRDRRDLREALQAPERVLRDRALFLALPRYVQAMFRNEVHPFDVLPAEGGGWKLPIKIHLLPGVALADVRDDLLPEWLFFGVETVLEDEPAADHGSPVDHPALRAIETVLRERYPGTPVGPMFLPWTATDSRFYRKKGIPSYGFTPFKLFTVDALKVGSVTERIPLPGYVEGVEVYRDLLRRLVT